MKFKTQQGYRIAAFLLMLFYIAVTLTRTVNSLISIGSFNFILVFAHMLSSSAPIFVSIEAMIFAVHGIREFTKVKTRFPKWRAASDILFGGMGLLALCLYIGISSSVFEVYEEYLSAKKIMTVCTVLICLYWCLNILVNIKKLSSKK